MRRADLDACFSCSWRSAPLAGVAAWRRSGDRATLAFGAAHFLRDVAWAAAIVVWTVRYLARSASSPANSMRRRPDTADTGRRAGLPPPHRMLALVPAFNEEHNLPRVVRELRRVAPDLDILVVNDGSTDGTTELLPTLGIDWLTLPQRVGVGGAVRAGLRYAVRQGYQYVVRIDGDGQHRACDVVRMLAPVVQGRLDASIGSRFVPREAEHRSAADAPAIQPGRARRLPDGLDASALHRSDVRILAVRSARRSAPGRHHPTGYAEPELVLFLCRNGLRVGEVPIRMRPRLAGRTSITPARATLAFARTILALMMVHRVTKAGVMTDLVQIVAVCSQRHASRARAGAGAPPQADRGVLPALVPLWRRRCWSSRSGAMRCTSPRGARHLLPSRRSDPRARSSSSSSSRCRSRWSSRVSGSRSSGWSRSSR